MDIALTFAQGTMVADIDFLKGDLRSDKDLETAITISLFSDARARDDDPLEFNESKRGWWGDTFTEINGDRYGSRLWLLRREKVLDSVLQRAKEYADEALKWLIDDRVAESVKVTTEVVGRRPNGILGIKVELKKPQQVAQSLRFEYAWEQL